MRLSSLVPLFAFFGCPDATQFLVSRRNVTADHHVETDWVTRLEAPHCANEECGVPWALPASNVGVRHNLTKRGNAPSVIFEVGGNIGTDLNEYATRFPAAKIFSFEPIPELFDGLQTRFGANPNVHIQEVGASNADGQATFTVMGSNGEATSSENSTAVGREVTVQLRDVDALLSEVYNNTNQNPDVVSVNCEGCEYDVLTRMMETGWLEKVGFVQLSWHLVDRVPDRIAKRCAIETVLRQNYEPAYHVIYGWQGWLLKTATST